MTILPDTDYKISLSVLNVGQEVIYGRFTYDSEDLDDDQTESIYQILPGQKSFDKNFNVPTQEILLDTSINQPNYYGFDILNSNDMSIYRHIDFNISEGRVIWNMALSTNSTNNSELIYKGFSSKDSDGKARVTVVSNFESTQNATLYLTCNKDSPSCVKQETIQIKLCHFCVIGDFGGEQSITILKGNYMVNIIYDSLMDHDGSLENMNIQNFIVGTGASYTLTITKNKIYTYQDINTNIIHFAWIIPQFFVLTVAEIMVSITGLEFAYTQAPKSIKSVLTGVWLLTISLGNVIVIIVAETKILPTQVGEYYLFAGLILVADFIFILLSVFYYEYVGEDEFKSLEELDSVSENIKENLAYNKDL